MQGRGVAQGQIDESVALQVGPCVARRSSSLAYPFDLRINAPIRYCLPVCAQIGLMVWRVAGVCLGSLILRSLKCVIAYKPQRHHGEPIQLKFKTMAFLIAAILRSYRGGRSWVGNESDNVAHVIVKKIQHSAHLLGYLIIES